VNILYDVKHGGGTVRSTPIRERKEPTPAPFAVGTNNASPVRTPRPSGNPRGPGLSISQPLHERFKEAVPTILERTGFPTGEVTVTSVPDVVFTVDAAGQTWTASYNTLTGSVNGTPADAKPETELGWRRFVLRLHTAHGYPGATNSRWFWALLVDAMACTMCFWGLSGLLMWWQIKATRKAGAVLLLLSIAAAIVLGITMYRFMRG
jgi:hypothetical protein